MSTRAFHVDESAANRPRPRVLPNQAGRSVILLVLAASLYFPPIDDVPFFTTQEAREAVLVQQEVQTGEWILPRRNRELPTKPPLFYWLGGLASLAAGEVSEWTVRLPSAILAVGTLIVFFRSVTATWGFEVAWFASIILATSVEWMYAATAARVDMTLAACLTGSFLSLERALTHDAPNRRQLGALYGSMALGTLAKGPVAIAIPVLAAALFLAVQRDFARARSLRPAVGLLVTLSIPAVWYFVAYQRGGVAFLETHFWAENVGRFIDAEASRTGHQHSVFYLIGGLLLGLLPWSLVLPPVLVHANRRVRHDPIRLFSLCWVVVIFGLFAASDGKRPIYLLPMYPALALFIGSWWADLGRARVR